MKCRNDFLYIGDGFDNTVKTFDAETGRFLGSFVASDCDCSKGSVVPGSNCFCGPRGLIFNHGGNLLVTNQNVGQIQNGDILKYNGETGAFLGELVRSADPNSPLAPRGIVLSKHNVLFVADLGDFSHGVDTPGEVRTYNGTTGVFLGNLNHPGFNPFHPRGLVFGPDGLLYVSVFDPSEGPNGLRGWVLRFDLESGEFEVFIESDDVNNLHRPEGLVFGPDGNLYVTSFQNLNDPNDTDKILIFDGETGEFLDKIDLYEPGKPRAFAQALLFGPDGKLFVPITGPFDEMTGAPTGEFTGSVRVYNVHTKKFKEIVPPFKKGGPLGMPWYLTFGNTNPKTLAYQCDLKESSDHHHHHPPHSPHDESSDESSS
jgi:DNA-binding beta-propeller fold protein YncE